MNKHPFLLGSEEAPQMGHQRCQQQCHQQGNQQCHQQSHQWCHEQGHQQGQQQRLRLLPKALGTAGGTVLARGCRVALRDGSARCRQRDFAAAAAKFSTALQLKPESIRPQFSPPKVFPPSKWCILIFGNHVCFFFHVQLCSKGFALEDPLKSSPDDISRLASWIESKLVICYLKLGQPGLALHHSHRLRCSTELQSRSAFGVCLRHHSILRSFSGVRNARLTLSLPVLSPRSIIQNPSHFCNHLRQAACFRCLHRYSEAARYFCSSGSFQRAPVPPFPQLSQ
ncbi:uncharacterized protein GJ701_015807 [Geothlypis trichas]